MARESIRSDEAANAESCRSEVRIVGKNATQNELMAFYIQREIGLNCTHYTGYDPAAMAKERPEWPVLFLWDAQNTDPYALLCCFDSGTDSVDNNIMVAVYNLDPGIGFDRKALDHGLNGIFFQSEPLKNIAEGIQSILKGNFWYSKETLAQFLLEQRTKPKLKGEPSTELTAREKEVLSMVHSGASNKDIADGLCISFHTVKTHIYNVFRKIHVNSRFHATMWASHNLSFAERRYDSTKEFRAAGNLLH